VITGEASQDTWPHASQHRLDIRALGMTLPATVAELTTGDPVRFPTAPATYRGTPTRIQRFSEGHLGVNGDCRQKWHGGWRIAAAMKRVWLMGSDVVAASDS
jgi:hypothetical protein